MLQYFVILLFCFVRAVADMISCSFYIFSLRVQTFTQMPAEMTLPDRSRMKMGDQVEVGEDEFDQFTFVESTTALDADDDDVEDLL